MKRTPSAPNNGSEPLEAMNPPWTISSTIAAVMSWCSKRPISAFVLWFSTTLLVGLWMAEEVAEYVVNLILSSVDSTLRVLGVISVINALVAVHGLRV